LNQAIRIVPPRPSLRDSVTALGDWEVPDPCQARALTGLILPTVRPLLILHYRTAISSERSAACFRYRQLASGLQSGPVVLRPTGETGSVTVRLKLGAAVRIFGDALSSNLDAGTMLDELYPASVLNRLEEQLGEAPDAHHRLIAVENFLEQTRAAPVDDAVVRAARLLQKSPMLGIGRLADRVGMSERDLRRKFQRTFGLSPKQFARIARMERLIVLVRRGASWGDAAYACGFFDQAHMINEIQAMTGYSPRQLWQHTAAARCGEHERLLALSDFSNSFFLPDPSLPRDAA